MLRSSVLPALMLLLLACRASTTAADGPAELPDQPWRVTDLVDDAGLRGLFVMHLEIESSGAVWLATADGLFHGDGYTWRRFTTSDGLPSNFVRSVHVRGDALWIGTDRGVAVRRNGRFEPVRPGPIGPNVRRIVSTSDGGLWFCCDTWLRPEVPSGLARLHDGRWTSYTEADGLPSNYVQDLFEDSGGRWYAFTLNGPVEWHDGRWRAPAGWPGGAVTIWSAAESAAGEVMFAADRDLFIRRDGVWRRIDSPEPSQNFAKSLTTVDGEMLAVSTQGLELRFLRWNGRSFVPAGATWFRMGYTEFTMQAPNGDVWCAGHETLARWERHDARWIAYDAPGAHLELDGAGRPWMVDRAGAWSVDGGAWIRHEQVRGSVSFREPGVIWSWQDDLLTRHDTEGFVHYGPEITGLRTVSLHLVDARGRSWFRGRDAEARLAITVHADGQWHQHPDAAPLGLPQQWTADHEGHVWIVGRDEQAFVRVLRLAFPEGTTSFDLDGVASVSAPRIHVDASGRRWVFGEFGLFRHAGTHWSPVTGLPGNTVDFVVDHGKVLWCVSNGMTGGRSGLSRLSAGRWRHVDVEAQRLVGADADDAPIFAGPARLHVADARLPSLVSTLDVPVYDHIHRAVRDRDGDLWVRAGEALLRYRSDGTPPETAIVSAPREIVRGEPLVLAVQGTERFRARAVSHFDYSWRFDGGDWSDFGPLPLGGLAAPDATGAHRLEVRARDVDGDVDPTPAVVAIDVLPVPLQQRAGFLPAVLAVIGIIGLLAAMLVVSRYRIRRYADRLEESVEQESTAARLSHARLHAAIDNIPTLVFEADPSGRCVWVNDRWQEITGRSNHAARGDGWSAVVHPDDRSRVVRSWQDAVEDGVDWESEYRIRRDDGSVVWVIARAVAIFDGAGGVARYFGMCTDINERKRFEGHQRRLMNELDHRVKNNLSALLSLLTITRASTSTLDEFVVTLSGRIRSMAHAHAILARSHWRDVPVRKILGDTLEDIDQARHRIAMSGPDIDLTARMAGPFALCMHELATNARKHGALRSADGRVEVTWDHGEDGAIILDWRELDGSDAGAQDLLVVPGAGLRLVRGLVEHDLAGTVDFDFAGGIFRCRMRLPPAVEPAAEPVGAGSVAIEST